MKWLMLKALIMKSRIMKSRIFPVQGDENEM
jgi:hypothetical protein